MINMLVLFIFFGSSFFSVGHATPISQTNAQFDQYASMQSRPQGMYVFDSQKKSAQFYGLLKELRCLVCQNQDLADSYAPLAKDLRQQVYKSILAGKSDQEIITYLTARYGDFILFNPPVKPLTWLLWLAPGIFLCIGFFIFIKTTQISPRRKS